MQGSRQDGKRLVERDFSPESLWSHSLHDSSSVAKTYFARGFNNPQSPFNLFGQDALDWVQSTWSHSGSLFFSYTFTQQIVTCSDNFAAGLQKIDLLGHSIGGNIAAAFAERYPQRIRRARTQEILEALVFTKSCEPHPERRLILLSPAGLCPEPKDYREKLRNAPWRIRLMFRFWRRGSSPMMLVRWLPRKRGRQLCARTAP